jgi:hypothetical protein
MGAPVGTSVGAAVGDLQHRSRHPPGTMAVTVRGQTCLQPRIGTTSQKMTHPRGLAPRLGHSLAHWLGKIGPGVPSGQVGTMRAIGVLVGSSVGSGVGKRLGDSDGRAEGSREGLADGFFDGLADGLADGFADGLADGLAEGLTDGRAEGLGDGPGLGAALGTAEGAGKKQHASWQLAASTAALPVQISTHPAGLVLPLVGQATTQGRLLPLVLPSA